MAGKDKRMDNRWFLALVFQPVVCGIYLIVGAPLALAAAGLSLAAGRAADRRGSYDGLEVFYIGGCMLAAPLFGIFMFLVFCFDPLRAYVAFSFLLFIGDFIVLVSWKRVNQPGWMWLVLLAAGTFAACLPLAAMRSHLRLDGRLGPNPWLASLPLDWYGFPPGDLPWRLGWRVAHGDPEAGGRAPVPR